jgi:hypothetical protein
LVSQPSTVTSRGDYFFLLFLFFCKKRTKSNEKRIKSKYMVFLMGCDNDDNYDVIV